MKEIKENLNKQQDILCSLIRRLSIIKFSFLSKLRNRVTQFLKNLSRILCGLYYADSKKSKGTTIGKTILKKNKVR